LGRIKRIGILTGGGDCPGLNGVIRAVAKTALHRYGLEVAGIRNGFGGLIHQEWDLLQDHHVSGILHRGGTILGTTNRDNPFRFPVTGVGGEVDYRDLSNQALDNLNAMEVDALVVVGGDGSLAIALEFFRLGVPLVGIPKTIDNDLMATDVTFGYDTALHTATDAIDKLHTTAESHHRAMLLEVMGRNSGWIALEAGLAGGADVVLIPEIPFTYENILAKLEERRSRGKKFSIIVVAEGARNPRGEQVYRERGGQRRLGGIGEEVAAAIEDRSGTEARVTVLGHLQRGGTPSPFDRILATRFGVKAVEMVMAGEFGRMACLKTPLIRSVPLEEAVAEQKKVPPGGELVRFARSVGTSFGDRDR
jgi:ATP-dependent phosphofructokinase / diphosphate-dependent phosphofructokinase